MIDYQLYPYLNACSLIGSLQTPQILELSGIGNQSILSKFGIKTEVDLPGVGENLRKSHVLR